MKFYDCMQRDNWRQLPEEGKAEVFAAIVEHFVHPKLELTNERLVEFEMCGIRCETYEFLLDGEEFVFIPGREKVTLGWQQGLSGLQLSEVIQSEMEEQNDQLIRYRTNLSRSDLSDLEQEFVFDFEDSFENYVTRLGERVNQLTTPLRVVDVPPMLVAKESQGVGTDLRGKYHIVSGEFFGDDDFWMDNQEDILSRLQPPLDLYESLTWEYPRQFAKKDQFYLAQSEDGESYYVYHHQAQTYGEVWLGLHRRGFQLLDEDAWEYCLGAGTRRLFRWGNEINVDSDHPFHSARGKKDLPNMFGLDFGNRYRAFELTDRSDCLKFDQEPFTDLGSLNQLISQSSYYRSHKAVSPKEELNPLAFRYRKSIIISRQ